MSTSVGGSPQSVVRAARFGLPLMLAVIGGRRPERFAPYVELYKRGLEQHGQPELPVGMHTLGFVAATDEELDRLRDHHRSSLVLCYLEGHTCEGAARQLGCAQPMPADGAVEATGYRMRIGSRVWVLTR